MTSEPREPADIMFSPAVRAVQARRGSRESFARMAARGGFRSAITPDLAGFLAARDSVYLATASGEGQPYIQHRGGPPGFLRVLDERTLGWADHGGNRQYVSIGNLSENPRAFLFAMDYESRTRVKIWGRVRVVEDDPDLVAELMPEGYQARPEQAFLLSVEAWDANSPQHIPVKVNFSKVEPVVRALNARIAALEAEVAALKGG